MPDGVRDFRTLHLYELLAAPLAALVKAESLAARTTLDFIDSVGILAEPGQGGEEREAPAQERGRLRMTQFRYEKLDENNQPAEFITSVPLLSLVPIPTLQIKEAKVSLAARIVALTVEPTTAASGGSAGPAAGGRLASWLQPRRVSMITKPAASSGPKDNQVRGTHHFDIEMSLGQADVTVGLERIFNLLDQSIRERKAPAD
jgi:hypothetical protein